jgi:hypothetical protein
MEPYVYYSDYHALEVDLAAAKIKLVEIDTENGELKEKLKLSRQDFIAAKAERDEAIVLLRSLLDSLYKPVAIFLKSQEEARAFLARMEVKP